MHGRSDGQTEKKAQVTEQVTIEQKTKEIKERIALFKLKYAKDLYDDERESNYSIIRSTREQVTKRERTWVLSTRTYSYSRTNRYAQSRLKSDKGYHRDDRDRDGQDNQMNEDTEITILYALIIMTFCLSTVVLIALASS